MPGALALVAFAAYAIFFYRDVLLTDRVYIFRDLYTFFYSIEHVARTLAEAHWPPLWSPLVMLGKPFAADPLAGVYYPPNWILRLLPVAPGFNLSLVFHHTWAAWGMFLLARKLGIGAAGTLLAGLLYGFAGPLVSCDNVYNGLLAATWAPWAVLAFTRWCERPSSTALAATAAMLALSLLGAMPELTFFTAVVLIALAVDRSRDGQAPPVRSAVFAIVAAGAIAAGLCAVQLVPAAEYVAQSSRAAGLNLANAVQYSLDPSAILGFVLRRGALHASEGGREPWLLTLYYGPVLALAAIALPRRRRWWAVIAMVALALALGEHLPGYVWVIERVPALRVVRYPEKFLLLAHGLLAFAAGAGLERLLGVVRPSLASVVAAAVVVLVGADLYRANARLLPSVDWSELAEPPQSLRRIEVDAGPLRPASPRRPPLRIYSNGIGLPDVPAFPDGFRLEKDLLLMQTVNLYGVANFNAPATINLADHEQLEQFVETVARERVAAILGAFDTSYLTSVRPLSYPGLTVVRSPATSLEAIVYRIEPLSPRAFVPRRVAMASGPEAALEHLARVERPAEYAVVEPQALPPALPEEVEGAVEIVEYLPERVTLRARMTTPGVVVLGDTFYPGWKATVDGAPAPVARANRFARAVFVAAGEHEVSFDYAPRSHLIGVVVSSLVALVLAGAMLGRRSVRRIPSE